MDVQFIREVRTASIPIGALTSTPIPLGAARWGQIHVNTWNGGITATLLAATAIAGVYRAVKDTLGAAVTLVAGSNRVIPIHEAVMVGQFMKLRAVKTAGSVTPLSIALKGG